MVNTRLLLRAPPIPGHNCRTGLPSRLPSRSTAGFTGYTPNLHSAHGEAMSRGQPAEPRKESRPDAVPMCPFQLPYLYQIYLFICVGAGIVVPSSYRWSSAIHGHHHFAYPRSSSRSRLSFPLAIPERRTRQIKRLAPPDRRPFQAREQFGDNVNSHPDVAHGDSQPVSNWSRGRKKSSNIQPYPSGTVCGQQPTRESIVPKGQRKDSGVTAVRLPSD